MVNGVDVNDNVFGQPNGLFIEEGIQDVQVLNVNDLANALKPAVLPVEFFATTCQKYVVPCARPEAE